MTALVTHMGASLVGTAISPRARATKKITTPVVACRSTVAAPHVRGASQKRGAGVSGTLDTRHGVGNARGMRRGKVVPTAVPNSFSPPPTAENGFGEIFFGKNPNKGKDHAPLQYRVLSLLPYLIPCMGAIAFTGQAFLAFPGTFAIAVGISPLLQIFYSNSFIPFVTFFTLFLAVVRNVKLNHFLRYNTMQAILLDICVMLCGLIMQYFPMFVSMSWFGHSVQIFTLMNALFALLYCAWNVCQGVYPEIPIITEAVYAQVRDQ